jgi:peptidoglycan/LPS O-acetylase OafA/YrhL
MTINIPATEIPHNSAHLTHPKYRADIDGLRAIAILSVVGFHAFPFWVKGGFIGVDIFFVISGFLISTILIGSLERNSFSFYEFYIRRTKRIFPALLLVLIATFLFGWFVLMPDEYKQLGKHIAGGAGFVSNFVLWYESGYFDNAAETKPLLHLWSLGVEEQFYIIWPLILWFAWKKRLNLLTIAIVVGAISFALNVYEVRNDVVAAFYSPQTRFWELMAGSILAYMTRHRQNIFPIKIKHRLDAWLSLIDKAQSPYVNGKVLRNVQSLFGAVLIFIGILVITKEKNFPGWWAVLPILGAVLIISAGVQAWLNRVVLSNRILVWFGLISFPLYLWHWPLLTFARIVEIEEPSIETRIAAVVISVVLAWLTYSLIEKPLRFGKHSKNKTITLLFLMSITGLVGYYCYDRDGLGFRKKFNLQMSEQKIEEERNKYWRNGETEVNYENHHPRFIIFGDSQAFDIFKALKNDKAIGLKIYQILYECSGFFSPSYGQDSKKDDCQKLFDIFLNSKELVEADTLIYSHYWEKGREQTENYKIGIQLIKKINPNIKIYFFGPKPNLGKTYISINDIIKGHRTTIGMNDFLNKIKVIREEDTQYAKKIAEDVGANFVDVNAIFCQSDCLFYSENKFSYFDRNHWTEDGAKIFYENLSRIKIYENMLRTN